MNGNKYILNLMGRIHTILTASTDMYMSQKITKKYFLPFSS